jgi:signal transduction histidine kinase
MMIDFRRLPSGVIFCCIMVPRESIDLGRAEAWLRAIGVAIWAFVGVSRLDVHAAWVLPWMLYGACLVGAGLHRRMPRPIAVLLLLAQTGAVIILPSLGFTGFEGLLMSIVVVQVPTILPLEAALLWALAQEAPLLAIVLPFKDFVACTEILGAYSTFSAFALLLYWQHERERRARKALADAHAEILATRALVVDGIRQSERSRISRELHDSLGHHLTALSVQLELARRSPPERMSEPVTRAHAVAKTALQEVRSVVSAMQSPESFDLLAALKAIAGGIPKPVVHIAASDAWRIDDREICHVVFRCVQEAITNSVKHADASNVWLEIDSDPDRIWVGVRDDGAAPASYSPGRGIAGIRDRMSQIGGTVELRSEPRVGFAVKLTVPKTKERAP